MVFSSPGCTLMVQSKLHLVLECLLCTEKYSLEDAQKGRYFLATRICRSCYVKGQNEDAKNWCFGKLPSGSKPGFSVKQIQCTEICPDREICSYFIHLGEKKHGKER
jgi:hypothetical protein